MTTTATGSLAVRFYLYGSRHLPIALTAERVQRALGLPLQLHVSSLRGVYHRWSGEDGADILVQANVADEEGRLVETLHPGHSALVYATGLPDAGYQALAEVDGLDLLDADIVLVR